MKLARSEGLRSGLIGALLGALGGELASELGFILTDRLSDAACLALGGAVGAVIALLGALTVLALADGLLLLCYFIIAFTPLSDAFAGRWVRSDAAATADAIVVLSGGLATNGGLTSQGLDRLLAGL